MNVHTVHKLDAASEPVDTLRDVHGEMVELKGLTAVLFRTMKDSNYGENNIQAGIYALTRIVADQAEDLTDRMEKLVW